MASFRVTYRAEIFVEAETKEDAQQKFEDLNLENLEQELADNRINASDFVDIDEIELH